MQLNRINIVVILMTTLLIASCGGDLASVDKLMESIRPNIEQGENIEILYTENGAAAARLEAQVMLKHLVEPSFSEFTEGVKVYVYGEDMQVVNFMEAEYGLIYDDQHQMIARRDVTVINEAGDMLNTEELIWNQSDNKLISDKFVKITTEDEVIHGYGLESNEDFSTYEIKHITGIFKVNINE